jgi:PilZ domain-containing protein
MSTSPPTQTQSPTGDQRVWLRYPSRRAVSCRLSEKNDAAFWPAQACDVSRGGIKLLSIEKLQRGSMLTIRLKDTESAVKAQVRYVLPSPEGKWMAGCAFLEELSEKELQSWLQD